ncbi:MAG: class I SAM-dependent methyltransferase [Roseivivax sp.]|nr:class I SAM-dependent methyltransferase [Roseivivax sp.]
MQDDPVAHWQAAYSGKAEDAQSWFQAAPEASVAMIERAEIGPGASVIDIGGGASRLVDALLARGFADITVLDLSAAAMEIARRRLGAAAQRVSWIQADITDWTPPRHYDLWHDRAAFHFLFGDQVARYRAALHAALAPGGQAVIATFAPDGPARCSGLPVQRYDPQSLARALGLVLVASRTEAHQTPRGMQQMFQISLLRQG